MDIEVLFKDNPQELDFFNTGLRLFRYNIYLNKEVIGSVAFDENGTVRLCYIKKNYRGKGYMSKAYSIINDTVIRLKPDKKEVLNNKMVNYWNKRGYRLKYQEESYQKILEEADNSYLL